MNIERVMSLDSIAIGLDDLFEDDEASERAAKERNDQTWKSEVCGRKLV